MATGRKKLAPLVKTVLLHHLFWIFIVTYFAWGFGLHTQPFRSFINASFFLPGFFIMVYSLLYILVPRFLLKRKFISFFIGLAIVLAACMLYTVVAQLSLDGSNNFRGMKITVGKNVLPFLHVGGIALSIKLLMYWYEQRQKTLEAEQQKTAAELQLLRAQLHPHFLFNTLNNLYSHTLEASPKSPEIVLKLSELLRFMIYEGDSAKIPLRQEIKLLKNYIALEQMRYGDRLEVSLNITGDVGSYQIAPLLLLPFLENAFKHGTGKQLDRCWINLTLAVEGSAMYFKLVNSADHVRDEEESVPGGLGLPNVRRRLELLYKDKHRFGTKSLEDVFIVDLEINLEKLEEKHAKMEMSYS
jgi:sensor histidine kinase YesM